MTLIRADGSFACPFCRTGTMLEHDVAYDECSDCTFFVIYDDDRNPPIWSPEELEGIYKAEALKKALDSPLYFISDTHFGHTNIASYAGRPQNHEYLMWTRLESVPGNATLVHVGDVVLSTKEKSRATLELLPGAYRVLVEGNHDRRMKLRKWEGWNNVIRYKQAWIFEKDGIRVAVAHRPSNLPVDDTVRIRIHGHVHEKAPLRTWSNGVLTLNLSVERTGYSPVSWEQILEWYKHP